MNWTNKLVHIEKAQGKPTIVTFRTQTMRDGILNTKEQAINYIEPSEVFKQIEDFLNEDV